MQLKIRFSDHLIGFASLLQLLFIGLKISFMIDWAWIWVLTPLWGCIGLLLVCAAIKTIYTALSSLRRLPGKDK